MKPLFQPMPVTALALALAPALAVVSPLPIQAQEDSAEAAEAPAAPLWSIACSSEGTADTLSCELSQSIVVTNDSGQSRRAATATIRRSAGSEGPALARFLFPSELLLTEPPAIAVDDAVIGTLAWHSCDSQGCHATADIGPDWLDAMRAGQALEANVAARNGTGITFTFQLRDFTRMERLMP